MRSCDSKPSLPPTARMTSSSYTALSALGAPITLEEYTRLCNGPLADVLTFLSEHLIGRHAAASARTTLFLAQEAQAKSQLQQPATMRSRADKAVARLGAAKTSSAVHSTQLAELQEKTRAASARLAALQHQLNAKRRTLLLLKVLDAKHALRAQRIEALTRKINELKHTPPQDITVPTPPSQKIDPDLNLSRISHTRDRLADLHRLTLVPSTDPSERLRRAIVRILSTDPNQTQRVVEHCLLVSQSRSRAREKEDDERQPDAHSLDVKSQSNKAKALELKSLIERCEALRLVSFRPHGTRPPFPTPLLTADSRTAKGHVELLRALILDAQLKSREPDEKAGSFASRVRHACGMPESTTTRAVLEDVEREHTGASVSSIPVRLHCVRLRPRPLSSSVDPTTAHAHAVELLTRKAAKAGAGQARAHEVEEVIGEWAKVVAMGEFNQGRIRSEA
ncbi:hypothetical protein MVEN_00234600 [Mycena venus]|uniref:Uncharacterized protein n=1 Tax=Mycena venus TaxID=2733690 RepID=A0A8H6Z1F3_9AGAR|nr:hypothetical protein MVEN_00234600 [Mycena venus]